MRNETLYFSLFLVEKVTERFFRQVKDFKHLSFNRKDTLFLIKRSRSELVAIDRTLYCLDFVQMIFGVWHFLFVAIGRHFNLVIDASPL